ncbi:hypothetical protein C7T94_15015 [Pedobacter yulinensis]|uniref:DUF3298 domain-containing protein n=1 Tax=Pedobacter yulinensis TaxID=2126353 RepID=A0A2T3HI48_9SPHI|nr:DUF3298 and DUF4163 domain-containing protein [Pedobacter yulinensis]PST82114.1 hypothetical protein C7T94_15015 [Pedobacter yulinensis]
MKKRHIFFALMFPLAIASCRNPDKTKETATVKQAPAASTKPDSLFYKHLEGTIGGKPVVMDLMRTGQQTVGSYYYREVGIPIKLQFDSLNNEGALVISEMTWSNGGNRKSPQFTLKWAGKVFAGTWKDEDKGKSYPITLTETYANGSVPFRVVRVVDSVLAFPGRKNSPRAKAAIQVIVAEANANSRYVNTQVKELMRLQGSDWTEALRGSAKRFFSEYDTGISEEDLNDPAAMTATMNYESVENLGVRYNENNFLVFEALNYAYTGGAHGNHGITFSCFDLVSKKKLQLKDIVRMDSVSLQQVVEKRFRQQYGLAPDASLKSILFDDFLPANNNVYFNSKGIGFLYNPYEVAAYAAGELEVFVPYSDLRTFLAPAFKQRMRIP